MVSEQAQGGEMKVTGVLTTRVLGAPVPRMVEKVVAPITEEPVTEEPVTEEPSDG